MPERAAILALRGAGAAGRGSLIATFTIARNAANIALADELAENMGEWVVSEFGAEADFRAVAETTRLDCPNARLPWFSGFEVVGGDEFSNMTMPYFGEIHDQNGVGGSIVSLASNHRISLRNFIAQNPRQFRLYGAATPVAKGSSLSIYALLG